MTYQKAEILFRAIIKLSTRIHNAGNKELDNNGTTDTLGVLRDCEGALEAAAHSLAELHNGF